MDLDYINKIAPDHDRTSCREDNPNINARFAPDDFGGCYRCTLLTAAKGEQPADERKDALTRDQIATLAGACMGPGRYNLFMGKVDDALAEKGERNV